jgi:ethanolamine utilization protein EutA
VGIDLGTTTTQVIFSRLMVENIAGAASVPRIQIIEKKVIYQGDIHFTPLLAPTIIDTEAVLALIEEEYRKAGFSPADLSAGAVIITGETARKENSQAVLRTMSGLAGDFVVATAGSDLESILAGRGAGTAQMSKNTPGKALANLDIGGGTSNLAVFLDGSPLDTSCLDIGGRQIMVGKDGRYGRVSPKLAQLGHYLGLKFIEGQKADLNHLEKLCQKLASIMAQALGLVEGPQELLDLLITAHPLKAKIDLFGLTFSGGVADFIYGQMPEDPFVYGDIGPILGQAVVNSADFSSVVILTPKETIRATVVGAGSNSLELSGSTVTLSHPEILPLKNLPILKLSPEDEANDYRHFSSRLAQRIAWFKEGADGAYQTLALAFKGPKNPSYDQVLSLRDHILNGLDHYLSGNDLLIIVTEHDLAKSLGQSLKAALPQKKIFSLDGVKVENGDYLDIGQAVSNGRVVPLVVKTLVFGQ